MFQIVKCDEAPYPFMQFVPYRIEAYFDGIPPYTLSVSAALLHISVAAAINIAATLRPVSQRWKSRSKYFHLEEKRHSKITGISQSSAVER